MPVRNKIIELRNEHDRVVVFTQDENLVLDYLINAPGRFNVSYNEMYWQKPEHKKICEGQLMPSFKVAVTPLEKPCDVGLDRHASQVVFTANPFFKLLSNDAVVKTKFKFPEVRVTKYYKKMDAVELLKPVAILFDSNKKIIRTHDWMVLSEIKHSVNTEEESDVHLCLSGDKVNENKNVYFDFNPNAEMLFPYYKNKAIYLSDMEYKAASYPVMRDIISVFSELPDSGVSKDFLIFRLGTHPTTISNSIDFLIMAGCVKRAYTDSESITIHKQYAASKDDIFRLIPDGTWKIKQIIKQMKIKRESLFQILKHYEGKGLNFSYVPNNDNEIFVCVKELTHDLYVKTNEYMNLNSIFLNNLISTPTGVSKQLNTWLDSKIEKHCLATGTKAVLFADGQATSLNFNSCSGSSQSPLDLDL